MRLIKVTDAVFESDASNDTSPITGESGMKNAGLHRGGGRCRRPVTLSVLAGAAGTVQGLLASTN